jgi:hypothetical protein
MILIYNKMKSVYYSIISIVAGIALTVSCNEDRIGQPPKDSIPPSPVFNVQVEELPGGAKITYELPNEQDISYVKGEFLFQGEKRDVRSSIYENSLIVEGLGSVEPVEITLYLVDHSENISEPVTKTFTPKRPPIETILESMKLVADFSGCNVAWENPLGVEIGLFFLAADDEGVLEEIDVLFTDAVKYNHTMRKKEGQFDTNERLFAVTVMDKWGNTSDTVYAILAPFFEKELDKKLFAEGNLPYDNTSVNNNRPLRNIWDGKTNVIWHTVAGTITISPQFFTINLGVEAKLSRFILWNRGESYYYGQFNPQFFEVWGARELKTEVPNEYWYEDWKNDWELLGDYEVVKPSGSPYGTVTADDKAIADAGFNFPFPLSSEPARYVRFVVKQTFMNALALHIAEITLFGSDGTEGADD